MAWGHTARGLAPRAPSLFNVRDGISRCAYKPPFPSVLVLNPHPLLPHLACTSARRDLTVTPILEDSGLQSSFHPLRSLPDLPYPGLFTAEFPTDDGFVLSCERQALTS